MGVFLGWQRAQATWSQFGLPSDLVLDIRILLVVFTADSEISMRIIIGTYPVLDTPPFEKFLCDMGSELGSVIRSEIFRNPEGCELVPQDLHRALGSTLVLLVPH